MKDCIFEKLPVETLVDVFYYLSLVEPPKKKVDIDDDDSRWSDNSYDIGWVKVTHVCRYWRDAAMKNPRLWATCDTEQLSSWWVNEFLERSKCSPKNLTLFIELGTKYFHIMKRLVDDEFRRSILQLSITSFKEMSPIVAECLSPVLPNIVELHLFQFVIPEDPNIFGRIESAPKLKTLHLHNHLFPWRPSFFASISELLIHNEERDTKFFRPSLEEIANVLAAMKTLKYVFLGDIFPFQPSRPSTGSITLPVCCHTAIFQESFAIEGCVQLFSLLNFMPMTGATLRITIGEASIDSPWTSVLREEIARRTRPQVLRLWGDSVTVEFASGYDESYLARPMTILEDTEGYLNTVRFEIEDWIDEDPLWEMMPPLCTAVDVSQVVLLELEDFKEESEPLGCSRLFNPALAAPGRPILQVATQVRVLVANDGRNFHPLFYMLAHQRIESDPELLSDTNTTGDPDTTRLCFPRLETLILDTSEFKSFAELIEDRNPDFPPCTLLECLKIRKKKGFPILKVLVSKKYRKKLGWKEVSEYVELGTY